MKVSWLARFLADTFPGIETEENAGSFNAGAEGVKASVTRRVTYGRSDRPLHQSGAASILARHAGRGGRVMRWPWTHRPSREARAESMDYAATIADALEAAAGAWSQAFASGVVTPATGPARGSDPATWCYRVYMNAPSGTTVAMRPAAGVVHAVYGVDPAGPWEGISPIRRARLSAALVSGLETRLGEEAGAATGRLLPFPDTGADAGWGGGRAGAPLADWKPYRIGADPPAALVSLRSDAERAILAACGL